MIVSSSTVQLISVEGVIARPQAEAICHDVIDDGYGRTDCFDRHKPGGRLACCVAGASLAMTASVEDK